MEKKQDLALVESPMGDNCKNLEISLARVLWEMRRKGKHIVLLKEKMDYDFKCKRKMDSLFLSVKNIICHTRQ